MFKNLFPIIVGLLAILSSLFAFWFYQDREMQKEGRKFDELVCKSEMHILNNRWNDYVDNFCTCRQQIPQLLEE